MTDLHATDKTNRRTLVWFSRGAASAVATRLTLRENPDALPVYCATGQEHEDGERFEADCVRWFNAPVIHLRLDVRLCRINDERLFIDEIPADRPTTNPIQPSCDFLCHIAEQDIGEAA